MNLKKMIEALRARIAPLLTERGTLVTSRDEVRSACVDESRAPTEDEATRVVAAVDRITAIDTELEEIRADITRYEDELRRDEAADALAREVHPSGAPAPGVLPGDGQIRVGQEPRTYARENDPKGKMFLRDVALAGMGNAGAGLRLDRHMQEEITDRAAAGHPLVEREIQGTQQERAAGTAAFAGLVVPQYLTDMVAPHAKAGRPFADACRHHDLPESGMTVNISRITTGTSSAIQTEGSAVSETDIDDTLLTINVQTNAGQQTLNRQAVERGTGIEDTTLEDLYRSHGTELSRLLLNQATNGLTNVATTIAYTDGTPTGPELYPKLLQGPSAVETALLDQDPGDTFAVMHNRRWFWLNSQLTSSWPLMNQPGTQVNTAGENYGERYGSGFRGFLPNGTPVVVDNNIATNLGAGTNEDEIYFAAKSECHLWEDPNAPMLIRADQTKAASLQILLVVYSYIAYTFARRPHAQKIGGTGLVTPTF